MVSLDEHITALRKKVKIFESAIVGKLPQEHVDPCSLVGSADDDILKKLRLIKV
jgi:hypothetical protein